MKINYISEVMVCEDTFLDILNFKKNIINFLDENPNLVEQHTVGYRAELKKAKKSVEDLEKITNICLGKYLKNFNLNKSFHSFSDWILFNWNIENKNMKPHNDYTPDNNIVNPNLNRKPFLTILFYLSNDCNGGELNFIDLNFKIKAKTGTIIIFPSNFMHEVLQYIDGERLVMQKYIFES